MEASDLNKLSIVVVWGLGGGGTDRPSWIAESSLTLVFCSGSFPAFFRVLTDPGAGFCAVE